MIRRFWSSMGRAEPQWSGSGRSVFVTCLRKSESFHSPAQRESRGQRGQGSSPDVQDSLPRPLRQKLVEYLTQ